MKGKEIGEKMKKRRKELDVSAADLAARLSMSKATIHRYENGDIKNIKLPVIESIARELNVNPLWLIGKSERKELISNGEPDFVKMLDDLIEFVGESICLTVKGKAVTREQQRTILTGLLYTKNYIDSIE